jgi:hypothetical protein
VARLRWYLRRVDDRPVVDGDPAGAASGQRGQLLPSQQWLPPPLPPNLPDWSHHAGPGSGPLLARARAWHANDGRHHGR